MGNLKSNAIYNPDEIRNPPPTNMIEQERDSDLEKYIRGNIVPRTSSFADTLIGSLQRNMKSENSLTNVQLLPQNLALRDLGTPSCVANPPRGLCRCRFQLLPPNQSFNRVHHNSRSTSRPDQRAPSLNPLRPLPKLCLDRRLSGTILRPCPVLPRTHRCPFNTLPIQRLHNR
jgi:hypothetical protein